MTGHPHTPRGVSWACIVVLVPALIHLGCGGSQKKTDATGFSGPGLEFIVHSEDGSNKGRPFRMLVRAVSLEDYLQETYGSVADKVMSPDDSVLDEKVIFPGKTTRVRVERPKKQDIAVYFLFSQPGDPWRLRIARTDLTHINLYLGEDRILQPSSDPELGE